MATTLILIPTYNERENILPLLQSILQTIPDADLLFLDDASPDGTGDLLQQQANMHPQIHVLHRPRKEGLGAAYLDGFRWGLHKGYSRTVCMDADLSHDPAELPNLLQALEEADLVIGSRYVAGGKIKNWSLFRRFLSQGGRWYARRLTRLPCNDPTGGFNVYRNTLLRQLDLGQVASKGYSFQIEMKVMAWAAGFRIKEVPITFTERRHGHSKMSTGIIREAFRMVCRLRKRPLQPQKPV
jgi:glycosyltransferase involved in cell wall biosynthesis